ncbi:MAG: hypothetical protein FGM55_14785 [Rhodoferax sp.]|nr:hypothetical protein [Rhodoferax sp.]
MQRLETEIATLAARYAVDEGLDYGSAKRRAVKALGLPGRTPLPDNERLDEAVREHIALFCADSQPAELLALRRLALIWMDRLAAYRPLIGGAVWQGTATRLSDIYLQLFCDDGKSVEIALIDQKFRYQARQVTGLQGGSVDALSLHVRCPELGEEVGLHLLINGRDADRGARRSDAHGRPLRGDAQGLRERMTREAAT